MFHVWAFDDVMTSEKLKFDYLKNEKSFRSKIRIIFIVLQVLSFKLTKQTIKNVVDATFKSFEFGMVLQ